MKKRGSLIIGIILLFALMFLSGCDMFQTRKVGVLNMDLVLNTSQRAIELQQELYEIGNTLEEEYSQQNEEEVNEDDENEQDQLDRLYGEYLTNKQRLESEFNQEINEILEEITAEEKLDIVIDKDTVYSGGIDITDEVIELLDERYAGGGEEENEE